MKYRHLPRILAAAIFSTVLISAPDSILSQQPAVDSKTLVLRVTAVDEHDRPIPGLQQEQFSVFEKKVQLPITSFETNDEPASIVFLFDVSGSVQPRLNALVAQLDYRFVQASNESNDYMVIAFHSRAKVLCGWGCRGDELERALTNIARIVPEMSTSLYDACDLAITQLQLSKHRKQVVFVVTDGQDNASKNTFNYLRKKIRESSVAIYAIGMIGSSDIGSSLGMEGQGILEELASISGGRALFPRDRKELPDVVDLVAAELRHQYTIGVNVAQAKHDNEWHPIKVKVAPVRDSHGKALHIFLRYREGFYDH